MKKFTLLAICALLLYGERKIVKGRAKFYDLIIILWFDLMLLWDDLAWRVWNVDVDIGTEIY